MEFVGLQGPSPTCSCGSKHAMARIPRRLSIRQPWIAIPTARGTIAVAGAYFVHGVEHILLGYDHLLFVFALLLIVRNVRKLVTTVTAFTLAHSITLGLSALGVVHVPGPPVEASIALSILLLACEMTRQRRGERSLTAQWPWLVAFAFGLLHGFGFASALADIGLPRVRCSTRALRLQCGDRGRQLGFIAAVLTLRGLVRRLRFPPTGARGGVRPRPSPSERWQPSGSSSDCSRSGLESKRRPNGAFTADECHLVLRLYIVPTMVTALEVPSSNSTALRRRMSAIVSSTFLRATAASLWRCSVHACA